MDLHAAGHKPRRRHQKPARGRRDVETIFTEGPLTDLINNAAGNFVSRTQDLTPRGFDAIANIVMAWHILCDARGGPALESPASIPAMWCPITVTWVRNGSPFVVPSAMSKSAIHAMTMSLAMGMGTLWHPAQHHCARRNPDPRA